MTTDTETHPLHVLIAGGGVAALETMIALRGLARDRVRITLLAPERDFRYRPMAVAEPFTIAHAVSFELAAIAADFDADVVVGALAEVEAPEHRVITSDGDPLDYDALVIACGTRIRPAFAGVTTIDDRTIGATLRGLVQDVEQGYTSRIAFVAPAQAVWPLPLYELALLTAHQAYGMNVAVDISIVTPEAAPLALFGTECSDEVALLLRAARIAFHGSSIASVTGPRELTLAPSGTVLRPERIVALPLLDGPRITGVRTDAHGFIPVTGHGEVVGEAGVYAAGDVTSYPIKHGGIAAQQADAVAAAIAATAGVACDPQPLRPVIRGALLTGRETRFFEAELVGDAVLHSSAGLVCPWDPPTKIAARHLGAYLSHRDRHALNA